MVQSQFHVSCKGTFTAQEVTNVLGGIKRYVSSRSREMILPLYIALLGFHLEYCTYLCSLNTRNALTQWSGSEGGPQKLSEGWNIHTMVKSTEETFHNEGVKTLK